jgi:hypothetical protein
MSKVMTRGSPNRAASTAPPTTPAEGPLSMIRAGWAAAKLAAARPPFDCIRRSGAVTPSATKRADSAVR